MLTPASQDLRRSVFVLPSVFQQQRLYLMTITQRRESLSFYIYREREREREGFGVKRFHEVLPGQVRGVVSVFFWVSGAGINTSRKTRPGVHINSPPA